MCMCVCFYIPGVFHDYFLMVGFSVSVGNSELNSNMTKINSLSFRLIISTLFLITYLRVPYLFHFVRLLSSTAAEHVQLSLKERHFVSIPGIIRIMGFIHPCTNFERSFKISAKLYSENLAARLNEESYFIQAVMPLPYHEKSGNLINSKKKLRNAKKKVDL